MVRNNSEYNKEIKKKKKQLRPRLHKPERYKVPVFFYFYVYLPTTVCLLFTPVNLLL